MEAAPRAHTPDAQLGALVRNRGYHRADETPSVTVFGIESGNLIGLLGMNITPRKH
jgi:hypothetical protein